jgi:hypothetical protein
MTAIWSLPGEQPSGKRAAAGTLPKPSQATKPLRCAPLQFAAMRYRIFLARTPYVSCPPLPDREGLAEPFPITLKAGEPIPRWPGLRLRRVSTVEGEDARDELLRQVDSAIREECSARRGSGVAVRPNGTSRACQRARPGLHCLGALAGSALVAVLEEQPNPLDEHGAPHARGQAGTDLLGFVIRKQCRQGAAFLRRARSAMLDSAGRGGAWLQLGKLRGSLGEGFRDAPLLGGQLDSNHVLGFSRAGHVASGGAR